MEEEGFGKRGSMSFSSSWASRLSPLAQPFNMKSQTVEAQTLNSLTSPNPTNHFSPSPSNHRDTFDDSRLSNSLANLINFEEDQVLVPDSAPVYPSSSQPAIQSDSSLSASASPFDGHKLSEFGATASPLRFSFPSSSLTYETETDGFSFNNKSPVSSARSQRLVFLGPGRTDSKKNFVSSNEARAPAPTYESLVKHDSRINPHKTSAGTGVSSLTTFQKVPQVSVFVSSSTSANFSPSSRALSSTADLTGNLVSSNNLGAYVLNPSSRKEFRVVANADSKEVHQDKSPEYKGKEIKGVESVSYKGLDPLLIAKSERKVTSDDIDDGLILGKSGTASGLLFESSSKKLDENDDDLDSPCWKGIQNSGKSSLKVPESVNSKSLQNESETCPSLNPEAPHFFPSHGKGIMDYSQNHLVADDFPSSSNVSYKDQKLVDPLKARPAPPGFGKPIGYQHSNGMYENGKGCSVLKSSKTSSAFNLPQMAKPYLIDGVFPEVNLAMEQIQNVPSTGVGSLSDFSQVLQSLFQSMSKCPNINVIMMVKVMHYLSELLVQNCADDYDSLNDEHETIQRVIDNLYYLSNHRAGQKTPMYSLPRGRLDYLDKAAPIYERPNMNFKVSSSKDLVVQRELDSWRKSWGKSHSQATSWNMPDRVSLSRDVVSERGDNVNPALVAALNGEINENLHSQALLRLLIKTQATLLSVEHENFMLRMESQSDGL